MNEAQLRAGAQVQQVSQDSGSLRTGAVLEVLSDFGKEEVLVVGGTAPVWLALRRARRGGRRGGRWRGAGELLIEVGSRRRHARGRRATHVPLLLLLGHPLGSLLQSAGIGFEGQLLGEDASSPAREAQRLAVTSHGQAECFLRLDRESG